MGIDVGLSEVDRIEVVFEEVNNEDITVELVDNPVTIELETPPEIQVAVNEIYSDVNVILDHDNLINRHLNKQHTAETIQESTSKRFTSDTEIGSKANQIDLTNHINDLNNPHETGISNLEGFPTTPTLTKFLRDDKTFAEIALKHSQLILPTEDVNIQHLTNAEKTQGALATGNAVLPTVKDVADRADRLLVDFTVPINTTSIIFDRDKNGVLFSDLNIEKCIIYISGNSDNNTTLRSVGLIRLNNINSSYKNGNTTTSTGFYTYMHGILISKSYIDIVNQIAYYSLFNNTSSIDFSNAASILVIGYKESIGDDKINTITILSPTQYVYMAGTNIKIYRND